MRNFNNILIILKNNYQMFFEEIELEAVEVRYLDMRLFYYLKIRE